MSNNERIQCGIDWIDGACRQSAKAGTAGWQHRVALNGEHYDVCPEHAKEAARE